MAWKTSTLASHSVHKPAVSDESVGAEKQSIEGQLNIRDSSYKYTLVLILVSINLGINHSINLSINTSMLRLRCLSAAKVFFNY